MFSSGPRPGDAGRGLWRGEDLPAGPVQRRRLSGRQLHLHRGHRFQGELVLQDTSAGANMAAAVPTMTSQVFGFAVI